LSRGRRTPRTPGSPPRRRSRCSADGVSATAVNVDTVDGKITIHGKVGTAAEKAKAEEASRKMDGVKDVKNLLQVVPQEQKDRVEAKDSEVKDRVEASLKAAKSMDDIKWRR
jgi:hypothetical protein